jgi:uncharacterized phage protein gp47/JayE
MPNLTLPTPSEFLQLLLNTLAYAYQANGITAELGVGSDNYKRMQALADRFSIANSNLQLSLKDSNPLTATGDALASLASIFNVFPRPAGAASGNVLAPFVGASLSLPADYTGTIGAEVYKTTGAQTYLSSPATVQIQAITPGAGGNQNAGAIFTWDSATIGNLNPTAVVDGSGLRDGIEADGDEALRQRLIERLTAPATGGNWSMAVQTAENATASVEHAYASCAARGPGSLNIACTAAGGDRTLASATLDTVRSAIRAVYPGQESIVVTTVTPAPVDISLAMSLPLPLASGGIGGGWRDASPWPAADVKVTAYNSGTGVATANGTVTPIVGQSIGIWDPTYTDSTVTPPKKGLMREYSVATVGGTSGAWLITVQGGFATTPLGAYVSAGAIRLVQYARLYADRVALLGPGQTTDLPELLPRAIREPTTDVSAPSDITSKLTAAVQDAYGEISNLVLSVSYLTGTTTPATTPPLPATTANPPKVFTLKFLAFRKA